MTRRFPNGWLLPNGNFVKCNGKPHIDAAREELSRIGLVTIPPEESVSARIDAGFAAFDKAVNDLGWIRLLRESERPTTGMALFAGTLSRLSRRVQEYLLKEAIQIEAVFCDFGGKQNQCHLYLTAEQFFEKAVRT